MPNESRWGPSSSRSFASMRPSACFDREPKVRQLDALIGPRSRSHAIHRFAFERLCPSPEPGDNGRSRLRDVAARDEDGMREPMRF